MPLSLALTDDPFISIECDEAIATIVQPMYPFRLVACASKLTELSPEMFIQCHAITDIQVSKVCTIFMYILLYIFFKINNELFKC